MIAAQMQPTWMQEVFQVGARFNTIQQGDCVAKLKKIPAGSVDLVFADPPFNIGYDYDVYDDKRSRREFLDWSKQWMSGVANVLKPSGTFWLAIGDEYAAELKLIAQDELGFSCRSWVIWYYTFGVNCVRAFSRSHTHLFHFVKDPDCYTFNSDNPAVRVLSARQLVYADVRANPKGRLPDNTWILRPQDAPETAFVTMHDTWYFSRVAGTFNEREGFHGCQMPEQLLGRIIRISSNVRDLVLDPFAGSGTTLAVAKKLGRWWLGIELSKDYAKRIKDRIESTRVGAALEGPENPSRSAPTTARGRKNVRLRNGRPLPHADEETNKGIIAAFNETSQGNSADYLLCDKELNAAFVASCKKKGLRSSAFVLNHLLLRIRKRGELPKTTQPQKRLTLKAMDEYSFASEIAMQLISLNYGLKLDDVLCSPNVVAEFDEIAAEFAPGHSSFEYRWAALAIRKRASKAKTLAKKRIKSWLKTALSDPIPLSRCDSDKYDCAGVYVVSNRNQELYVGETYSLRSRARRMLNVESWTSLEPRSVRFIRTDEQETQYGLQSFLIHHENPLLNLGVLRPELPEPPAKE